jgi:hypothetical protein
VSTLRVVTLAVLLAAPTLARATPPYQPLPALDGTPTRLQVRVLKYTGGTNGEMVVEVQNPGTRTEVFAAQGLYFVPDGDPEKAPQRLGAAGPFQIDEQGQQRRLERLELKPKAKAEVRLQVFCIDSHRGSPTAAHKFNLSKERLPRELRRQIDENTQTVLRQHKGNVPAAKAEIQSGVWNARDSKWLKLDGERRHEKAPRQESMPQQRRHQRMEPQQQRVE